MDDLDKAYAAILADLGAQTPWVFEDDVAKRYTIRQGVLERYRSRPIFEARPSLYDFMVDITTKSADLKLDAGSGQVLDVRAQVIRDRHVVKLGTIAEVKTGLQSGANTKFYRTAAGVTGGAAAGGYHQVPEHQIVAPEDVEKLTDAERAGGIEVDDPSTDRFYVPLDKAGVSDVENGLLAEFWRPVEFYVNWSRSAVEEMKSLRGARVQNSASYFEKGISFSSTGI